MKFIYRVQIGIKFFYSEASLAIKTRREIETRRPIRIEWRTVFKSRREDLALAKYEQYKNRDLQICRMIYADEVLHFHEPKLTVKQYINN